MNANDNIWLTEYEGLLWSPTHRTESPRPRRDDAPELPDYVNVGPHVDLTDSSSGKPVPLAFLE